MSLSAELKEKLRALAEKYEAADFLNDDPSRFLRWYSAAADIETASFIAAMLSFGNRKQFIPKIQRIFELADAHGGMANWLSSGEYRAHFYRFADACGCAGDYNKKFYRFYSYEDMAVLFDCLHDILKEGRTMGEYVQKRRSAEPEKKLCEVISSSFEKCAIVPHGKTSANKRIQMYLRWMVRRNSPVDVGIWNWFSPADLIIPLDTHVIQESEKLSILPKKSGATLKNALALTEAMKEIWPDDPCKGDFALFGLGVDSDADA